MSGSPARADDDRASLRAVGRWALGLFLVAAGVAHAVTPETFLAQVPPWMPARLPLVYVSGIVEVALGLALMASTRRRVMVGWLTAAFLTVIVVGNISQAMTGTDAFGLETPAARWTRVAAQPLLVAWALWSTGAWRAARLPRR